MAEKLDSKARRRASVLFRSIEVPAFVGDGVPGVSPITPEEREELQSLAARDELFARRLAALERAGGDVAQHRAERDAYVARYGVGGVRRFRTSLGAQVFLMPVETFPGHVNNIYLVADGALRVQLDCGSGMPSTARDLATGYALVNAVYGVEASVERLDFLVVSHAHIDHYGGLHAVREQSAARVCVHELDARVLANFEERLTVAAKDVDVFLRRAGMTEAERAAMGAMYTASKRFFHSVEPDRVLRDHDVVGNGYRVHHVPGHCPGLICLQVGDALLTSDHVLARTTPHQFPQQIMPFGGLEHYFRSLGKVRKLEGIDVALGGHEEPIHDLRSRIDEIATFHRVRLAKVEEIASGGPVSVLEITHRLFPHIKDYGALLGVLEAGAHVEYLHQMGRLRIANLDEVASRDDPVILYEVRA